MTKRIILASHALLAKGFNESLQFIFKPNCEIYTICAFTEDENPIQVFDELFDTFDADDTVLVLTDLSAGSVNKLIAQRLHDRKFYLISGVNLALVLELAFADSENINEEYLHAAISRCKEDMMLVNDALSKEELSEEEFF